jgi:hypothetical protein
VAVYAERAACGVMSREGSTQTGTLLRSMLSSMEWRAGDEGVVGADQGGAFGGGVAGVGEEDVF